MTTGTEGSETEEHQWHRNSEPVKCIRCDEMTNEFQALYYEHGMHMLHLCPDCFREVEDRDQLA